MPFQTISSFKLQIQHFFIVMCVYSHSEILLPTLRLCSIQITSNTVTPVSIYKLQMYKLQQLRSLYSVRQVAVWMDYVHASCTQWYTEMDICMCLVVAYEYLGWQLFNQSLRIMDAIWCVELVCWWNQFLLIHKILMIHHPATNRHSGMGFFTFRLLLNESDNIERVPTC